MATKRKGKTVPCEGMLKNLRLTQSHNEFTNGYLRMI